MKRINYLRSVKNIKKFAETDFGVVITDAQAKEIKSSLASNCAIWTAEHYTTTRGSDDINSMSRRGVHFSAYKTFYTRAEWNKAIRAGEFN